MAFSPTKEQFLKVTSSSSSTNKQALQVKNIRMLKMQNLHNYDVIGSNSQD